MYRLIGDTHTLTGLPYSVQAFLRAFDSVRRQLAIDMGVSGTELRALSRIAEEAFITPKALAEFLELSTPAVTAITNTLVTQGLVERAAHPSDRRSLLLELTPEGHSVMETMYTSFQSAIVDATTDLDPDQLATLDASLLVMARHLGAIGAPADPDFATQ